jgi:hypothetical protein
MGGGDQVDVQGALGLEFKHDFGQLFGLYLAAKVRIVTNVIVLAKDTTQIATGKKNGS